MKILIIILMFFVMGALLIISNNNLALYKSENLEGFYELYVNWLDKIYNNIQSITGDVIKKNWLPE